MKKGILKLDFCEDCGKLKEKVYKRKYYDNAFLCNACVQKRQRLDPRTHEQCSRCGKLTYVAARDSLGKPICVNCYQKDPANHKKCSRCGKVAPVATRDSSDKPICQNCYEKRKRSLKNVEKQTVMVS